MQYEEKVAVLGPGEHVLFHSDGIAEAHSPRREMFGFARLKQIVAECAGGELIGCLLAELERFTGDAWEQEDDVTLVMLRRAEAPASARPAPAGGQGAAGSDGADAGEVLADFTLPSEPGNERLAMQRVADAVRALDLPPLRLERLKTAVAEATMNAIEHGNEGRPELPVAVTVLAFPGRLVVRVTDVGGGAAIPETEVPDLEAKLAGRQKPRGWGLFLIQNMVDEMRIDSAATHHTVELILHLDAAGSERPVRPRSPA
jgi:anti-sigma regulatory factor (Ser/Thr protein kinase)